MWVAHTSAIGSALCEPLVDSPLVRMLEYSPASGALHECRPLAPSFSALCVRRSQAPPGAIMQTDYSVNTMNLATPETPLTSIGLRPVGFAPTIVRDALGLDDQIHFLVRGAATTHVGHLGSRAARLPRRDLPWPARWWSNTRPSNARRLTKGATIGRTPVERCAAAQVFSDPSRHLCVAEAQQSQFQRPRGDSVGTRTYAEVISAIRMKPAPARC
jgi:hypothetical protein